MLKKIYLRDRNGPLAAAWKKAFEGIDVVDISVGDIFEGPSADALLSPANSFGFMDGGIDLVYVNRFGWSLQDRVQAMIRQQHDGELPVGQAIIVPTADTPIQWLVASPTMRVPMDVANTPNAFLAFRAALQAIKRHNETASASTRIESLLSPGLGTAIGKMPYERCARQMRLAYDNIVLGVQWKLPSDARGSQAKLTQ
jgi:O-acetyl-ADP-ribose deacetylase (regulator of RNase III)